MPTEDHNYKIRYHVEEWDKTIPESVAKRVGDNIVVVDKNYGYTDEVIVISTVYEDDEKTQSHLILSSADGGFISRERLVMLRDLCTHYLEHQTDTSKAVSSHRDCKKG